MLQIKSIREEISPENAKVLGNSLFSYLENGSKDLNESQNMVLKKNCDFPTLTNEKADEFIQGVKKELGIDLFLFFLRVISLYIGGSISNRLLVKLCIKIMGKSSLELIKSLPFFLSHVHCNLFEKYQHKDISNMQEMVYFIIICVTSASQNDEASSSIFKCFVLLSEGYISRTIAKKWLSCFETPEIVDIIDQISDLSLFHPSKIPTELVLCHGFRDRVDMVRKAVSFGDCTIVQHTHSDFQTVSLELLENQMFSIRKIILKLADKKPVTTKDLEPFFGERCEQIIKSLPEFAPWAISRLSCVYFEKLSVYRSMIEYQEKHMNYDSPDYRFVFQRLFRYHYSYVHYLIPHKTFLNCKSKNIFDYSMELVYQFALSLFPSDNELINNFSCIHTLTNGEYFLANKHIIQYLLNLSLISQLISEYIDNAGLYDDLNVVCSLSIEGKLSNKFSTFRIQHIDMVLVNTCKLIKKISVIDNFSEVTKIKPYPFIVTVCMKANDKGEFGALCQTEISPFL